MGSGKQGELTLLDVISIMSFLIGIENLELNITQEDVQNLEASFDKKFDASLNDIHQHLAIQDVKLNHIINLLEGRRDDS